MARALPPNPDIAMSAVFAKATETWSFAMPDRLEQLIARGSKVISTREDVRVLQEMKKWLAVLRTRETAA